MQSTIELRAFDRDLQEAWRSRSAGLVLLHHGVSTQDLGRLLAHEYTREGVTTPTVDIVAWEQTAGEGRGDHRWSSPGGLGVYLSMVRPMSPGRHLQQLPILCAVAVCDLLNTWLDGRCRLKWPNDLLVDGRKIAGLLIELISRGDEEAIAILGMGINREGAADAYRIPHATSIAAEAGSAPEAVPLTAALVDALESGLDNLETNTKGWLERYRELVVHQPGESLRCQLKDEVVEGTFEGFDEHGFLQLRVDGTVRTLTSGVVELDG